MRRFHGKPRGPRVVLQKPHTLEEVAEANISGIASGGDGVARVDGLAVFVPRTAPGDTVQLSFVKRGRLGRGRVLRLINKSPDRVEPRCIHYDADNCGGCQLQHLSIEAQRTARQHIVQETLQRLGKRSIQVPSIVSGKEWNYRSRLTLTLNQNGAEWVGGLRRYDDPSKVFALTACEISHPLLVDTWRLMKDLLDTGELRLPGCDQLRLSFRLESDTRVAIVIIGGQTWSQSERWMSRLSRIPYVNSVWWESGRSVESGNMNVAGSSLAAGAGDSRIIGGGNYDTAIESLEAQEPDSNEVLAFAQINSEVARALRTHVLESVLGFTPNLVIDGYAGTGVLTEALIEANCHVVAVESDPVGAQGIMKRAQTMGTAAMAKVEVLCDLMERAVEKLDACKAVADVVVVNPPRRGLDLRVAAWLERIAQRGSSALIYVSCDPATLARDLTRLPSWKIVSVRCFDMFPQTAHVETVCVLQRSEGVEAA